ncbi:hypothetical protein WDU94_001883 [Cyamophila willieti]
MASWKARYNVNRLTRNELEYELDLRSMVHVVSDEQDALSAKLRLALLDEDKKYLLSYTRDEAKDELTCIELGLQEINDKLKECTCRDSLSWDDVVTKYIHLSERLNRMLLKENGEYEEFNFLKSKLQISFGCLESYIEQVFNRQRQEVLDSRESAATSTATPTAQSSRVVTPLEHYIQNTQSPGQHLPFVTSSGQYIPVATVSTHSNPPSLTTTSDRNPWFVCPGHHCCSEGRIKIPKVTPPCFDGKEDVEEFLKEYNLIASVNNWPNTLKWKYNGCGVRYALSKSRGVTRDQGVGSHGTQFGLSSVGISVATGKATEKEGTTAMDMMEHREQNVSHSSQISSSGRLELPVYNIFKTPCAAISATVFEKEIKLLVDTGAGKSVASYGLVQTLPELKLMKNKNGCVKLCSAGGELLQIMGQAKIPIQIEGFVLDMDVFVIKNLVPDILMGMDFLSKFRAKLDFDDGTFTLRTKSGSVSTRFTETYDSGPDGEFFLAGTYEQTTHRGKGCSKARVKFSSHLETHNRIGDDVQIPRRTPEGIKSILKKNGDNMKKSLLNPVDVVPYRVPETQGCVDVGTSSIMNINELTSKLAVRNKLEDVANISPDVSFADKERLINILSRYKECLDAFSNDIGGNARVAPIKLTLKDNIPVRTPPYRVSLKERQIMAEIVEDMKRQGIVYNSSSPYASPALLVRKNSKVKKTRRQELTKDDFRLCVDYRGVNKHIDQSSWPLERAEDIFARLANSSYYITADLKSGFLQLPLDKESQMVLSAVTQDCSFAYNTLPFGVNCAPNLFQKTMREVFHDIKPEDLLIFMDDLVIHAQTIDELLKKFEKVLKRMEEVNLKINLAKCQFIFSEIDLLGHRISKEGVMVSQSKVKSIVDFKAPKTVKQVRQFLGMSGYYRKFCQDYSRIAAPLTDLTKQDKKFEWTEREQKAFERLKEMLITAPVLRYFDENLPTILSTDASIDGIGAVLEQTDEHGKTHPVAYASRKLSPTERRYANIDREGLGISWAYVTFGIFCT